MVSVTLDDFLKPGGNRDVVFCTYCSRTKDDQYDEGIPEKLYISGRVKSFFKHAPVNYKKAILSYKYGIVPDNLTIDNYELSDFNEESEWWFRNIISDYKRPLLVVWLPRPCEAVKWEEFLNKMKVDWVKITKIKGVNFDTLIEGLDISRRRI